MPTNKLKKHFPFTKKYINLNNAGMCPPPIESVKFINKYHKDYAKYGLDALINIYPNIDKKVKTQIAELISAKECEIALTHNTSEGLNIIAQGYPFKKGDKIITASKEYPSNVYPWLNLNKKGVELIFIEETDGEILIDNIEKKIDKKVKMISISFVEWCTGYRNDIKKIGAICKKNNIPLVIDGAQGIGAIKLDMKENNISALACPTWKWLWGPLGLGFLYMEKDFMTKLNQVFVGADGVKDSNKLLDYKLIPKKDMSRFEFATKNYADIVQFYKSMELTLSIGIKNIEKKLIAITNNFIKTVKQCGGIIYGDFKEENKSGIFSFTFPGIDPTILHKEFKKYNIIVNVRDDRVRIAPHIYLDEKDINLFKTRFKKIIKENK